MTDVQQFLESRHHDHYKVYNLCSERAYETSYFHGRVERFPFDDHNAPPFDMMRPFCQSVDEWLRAHKDNVIAVHCKAGKGRTGVMICAYLVHCGMFTSASESLEFYGKSRTNDQQGVTIPSQRRFVEYYASFFNNGSRYLGATVSQSSVILNQIVFHGVPVHKNRASEHFVIKIKDIDGKQLLHAQESQKPFKNQLVFKSGNGLRLTRDFKVIFEDLQPEANNFMLVPSTASSTSKKKKKDLLHFWLNTHFMGETGSCTLTKSEIDRANKDKKHKKFPRDFRIEVIFSAAPNTGTNNKEEAGRELEYHNRVRMCGSDVMVSVCGSEREVNTSTLSTTLMTNRKSYESDMSSRDSDEFTDPDVGDDIFSLDEEQELIEQIEEEYNYLLNQQHQQQRGPSRV